MIKRLFALASIAGLVLAPITNAKAASNFSIEQSTTELLTVDSHLNDSNAAWAKDFFAIGPYKWTTTIKKDGQDFSTEFWQASPVVNCHKSPNDCRPAGVNGGNGSQFGRWLWGFGWEFQPTQALYEYGSYAVGASALYNTNCGRGNGPAIAWEPNCSGTTALYATGQYGWTFGGLARHYDRDGPYVSGVMMPLQWEVRGFLSSPPPPSGGGAN